MEPVLLRSKATEVIDTSVAFFIADRDAEKVGFCYLERGGNTMKKVSLFILAISVIYANATFAVVDRGILVTGGGSICMEGETHFLMPDPCFEPTYGILRIDGYVDPSYINQSVEVEGELYYGLLCIMIDVETITLLGDPNQDTDEDGENDVCDNCPNDYNPNQQDTNPPQGNGIGDACDCEGDFNCDGNVDAEDVMTFLTDFGRSQYFYPCSDPEPEPCKGDFIFMKVIVCKKLHFLFE